MGPDDEVSPNVAPLCPYAIAYRRVYGLLPPYVPTLLPTVGSMDYPHPGHSVAYLRLIDSCITQLKAQGPSRTCNESKEEEEEEAFKKSV